MKKSLEITRLDNEILLDLYRKNGNQVYFGELYKRYIPLVYGLCLKYLENESDAQDAVMDLYEDLLEKVRKYDITNFHTWLYSVAKNHCFQRLRKDKRTVFVNLEQSVMENDAFFTLTDKEQSDDEKAALNYCMAILNVEQKTSIVHFFFEDKSYAEIVSVTGYSLDKVKSYIQNGKRNLKNCITKFLQKTE